MNDTLFNKLILAVDNTVDDFNSLIYLHPDILNYYDENGGSLIWRAINSGEFDLVKLLIARGLDLRRRSYYPDRYVDLAHEISDSIYVHIFKSEIIEYIQLCYRIQQPPSND